MIRFVAGVLVGAFGGAWFLGWLFTSSREEATTTGESSVHLLWPQADTPAT